MDNGRTAKVADIESGRKRSDAIRATDINDFMWKALMDRPKEGLSEAQQRAVAAAQMKRLRRRERNRKLLLEG